MPWIVPVASAVIGAAGSLFSANKSRQAGKDLQKQQQPLIDLQTQNAKTLQPYVGGFYQRAQSAFDPAFNYYKNLMSGNRGDLVSALAPEIGGINQRYNTATQQARELSPRGGATTAMMGNLPYQRAGEIQALISGGRANAANALGGLAGVAGGLGSSAAGFGNQAANSAMGANQNQFNNQQYVNAQQAAMYQQLADSLGSLVKYDANTKKVGWAWGG